MQTDQKNESAEAALIDITKEQIFRETAWYMVEDVNRFQPEATHTPAIIEEWKNTGQVFSVYFNECEYFAAYQFDARCQPRPVIKAILDIYGSFTDSWSVAAWFHFPNGWIPDDNTTNPAPLAPKDALDKIEEIINAARHRRGTYIA